MSVVGGSPAAASDAVIKEPLPYKPPRGRGRRRQGRGQRNMRSPIGKMEPESGSMDQLAVRLGAPFTVGQFKGYDRASLIELLHQHDAVLLERGATKAGAVLDVQKRSAAVETDGKGACQAVTVRGNRAAVTKALALLEAVLQYGDVSVGMKRQLVEIETKRAIFNAKIAAATRQVDRLNRLLNDLDEIEAMV